MVKRPLAIDLFAGCGGTSLGLEAAGFDVVAAVELDPVHALVHDFNFSYGVTFCQDVKHIHKLNLLRAIEQRGYEPTDIDVLAGGPPCQGFSVMGKRQLEDPRNGLVFEYVRLLREIQPKYFIFENVQGMTSTQHRGLLKELLSALTSAGYVVLEPRMMNAADYGAPQNRKRLILLGYRLDVVPIAYPEPTHGTPLTGLQPLISVKQAIADLEDFPVFTDIDRGIPYSGDLTPYGRMLKNTFRLCHERTFNSNYLWGHLGSNHAIEIQARFQQAPTGKKEKISRLFKLDANKLANTLRAGTPSNKGSFTAPRPIHYSQARCISIREAARLHTFPDWFQLHRKVWHGFREIGNAVVPLLAKSIGDRLIAALEINHNELDIYQLPQRDEALLSLNPTQAADFWGLPTGAIARRLRKPLSTRLTEN